MAHSGKRLIVGNWKMNPVNVSMAVKLFDEIKQTASRLQYVQTVVCPPYLFLEPLKKRARGNRLALGAQDAFSQKGVGAFTGEISPQQLVSSGARYVILGHSERRALGEDDQTVFMKAKASLESGLGVIVCVGEKERDENGSYLESVAVQLRSLLSDMPRRLLLNLVIAYEPIWAIGTESNGPATPKDVREMAIFIRRVTAEIAGVDIARSLPVLYGGSVGVQDSSPFLVEGGVDGLLIGRESLNPKNFCQILNIANENTTN